MTGTSWIALVLMGLGAVGWGAVSENINRLEATYLYVVKAEKLHQYKCTGKPETVETAGNCVAHHSPILLSEFKKLLETAGHGQRERIAKDTVRTNEQLRLVGEKLSAIELSLTDPEVAGSSLANDYRQRRSELQSKITELRLRMSDNEKAVLGLEEIFSLGILSETVLHPVSKESLGYFSLRPWVALFDHVFAEVDGKQYGENSWVDPKTRRVLWSDFVVTDLASPKCPSNYMLFSPTNFGTTEVTEVLQRFADAILHGETGFRSSGHFLYSFSGGMVPFDRLSTWDRVSINHWGGSGTYGPKAYRLHLQKNWAFVEQVSPENRLDPALCISNWKSP